MITPTQKRALRAQSLLDGGMDPREAAKECGYKNVNGMMGAIALCSRKMSKQDMELETQRMQEAEAKQPETPAVLSGEYEKPGVYELPAEGEVIVGEKIPDSSWEDIMKERLKKIKERFSERSGTVQAESKRVSVRYGRNDKNGRMELRIHIFGIDKWIVIDEENIGGKEEMIRIIDSIKAGLQFVREDMA
jgi:hypothetical protein